jgi:carboxyl-terminal processing protease
MMMKKIRYFFATVVAIAASSIASAQTVIEYINQQDFPKSPGGQFFYSADPSEQAYVDSGAAGQFKRTGGGFVAGGPQALCRFYGSVTPGPNSHFYTILPDECSALKSQQVTPKPAIAQQWNFEGPGFSATPSVKNAAGVSLCPQGSAPIFRAYNQAYTAAGAKNVWDSNHRYSARRSDIDYLVNAFNWKDEGVAFCAAGTIPDARLPAYPTLEKQCSAPRADIKYGDKAGTLATERDWVRSFVDERYLWPEEVPTINASLYINANSYFSVLKTHARLPSGIPKDALHGSVVTSNWEILQGADTAPSYGIEILNANQVAGTRAAVRRVVPGSPAAAAGVLRGMEIATVNGVNVAGGANSFLLVSALTARSAGESHRFGFITASGATLEVSLTPRVTARTDLEKFKIFATSTGNVGYVAINAFSRGVEGQLASSFDRLAISPVSDLIVDLRYNADGLISVASQLAYVIGGNNTQGKLFTRSVFNRKRAAETNDSRLFAPFLGITTGSPGSGTIGNSFLPTANLKRVYLLTSNLTAGPAEMIINGLRGIDIEVILIGGTTGGNPYNVNATENCATTYLMVESQFFNAKGESDYANGFAPTCKVETDDLNKELGDLTEARLAAALAHRATGACPAGT